ncbi:UvrD-helicase domain-containing protein [Curvibacter sp. CHRR-16]|uniref:UvrD-helicase domain-containing protein n=1 Tax=Curvibacter sp. CHRR-16 TaxID=2835872 RepID=UPI001BD992EC|nr:UvrD-helicase domain-containing protein [Curvibacter sp. CHRR-16]MBT0570830.1 UvrD-helicase domain-containing protein [Curvibacter sp. CHRR-16]
MHHNHSASPLPPLLQNLNAEQLAAVTLPAEHALILAGAGSGKTRVLTTRIAWLLQQGLVSPGGILAVTFTNKAAKEMLTRLSAMLPINARAMWIGTFHGLCNRFLRAHYQMAGLPQAFQILDTQDSLSAIKRLCKQYQIDDEHFPPKELSYFIANCKEEGMRPKDVPVRDPDTRKKVEIYQLYEEQCQREGVVDFGELMLRSYELLRDHPEIRQHYQRRFRHILIDEFQDTNKLQYAWLKMLCGLGGPGIPYEGGAVLAVGDDDQSIYAFRGARVGNMSDFVREFGVQHQIKLEQNYRSYSNILDSANALISHNSKRLGKNLRTTQGAGEPVRVYQAPTDLAEAQWLVDEVKQLRRDDVPLHEVAILYRSNAQSRVLETALFNAALPYRVYGGLRFFERAEIKSALAYLRLLENPHDDTSFLRVVNFPARGIGARSIEQLQDLARASGCSLHDAVSTLTGRAGAVVAGFVAKMDVLRERTAGQTLKEIVLLMLEHSGLVEHYRTEKEGQDRIENLQELVNAAESFVMLEGFGRDAPGTERPAPKPTTPAAALAATAAGVANANAEAGSELEETGETLSPLQAFLTHAALESGDNMAAAGQDAVQLMTVHAAKGLEFDCVFITGLEEGLFPHENSQSDRESLEEERRLMYVAITRARKRLYLTHSQTRMLHGQTRYGVKSRFFDELPEECLRWLTPKAGLPMANVGGYGGGGGSGGWQGASGQYGQSSWAGSYPRSAAGGQERGYERERQVEVPRKEAPAHGLRKGQKVFHTKFGEGQVVTLEGSGDDARAQVHFPRHGTKWLALSVAKLTPVE